MEKETRTLTKGLLGRFIFGFLLLFIGMGLLFAFLCLSQSVADRKLNDDISHLLEQEPPLPTVALEVPPCTATVSSGYAAIEMLTGFLGGTVTEEDLLEENGGQISTGVPAGFAEQLTQSLPDYDTVLHKKLTNSELISLAHKSLAQGVPVPVEYAVFRQGIGWDVEYGLITGMDLNRERIALTDTAGQNLNYPVDEFLEATRLTCGGDAPWHIRLGLITGQYAKNTLYLISPES